MRKILFGSSLLLSLACAGITEGIVEEVTGSEIEIRENGMDMSFPDGGKVKVNWGEGLTHPAALRLPPPPRGALALTGEAVFPNEPISVFAMYGEIPQTQGELVLLYRQEMEKLGLSVTEEVDEEGARILRAVEGEIHYFVSAPKEDGTLALGMGSPDAIERGLNARP